MAALSADRRKSATDLVIITKKKGRCFHRPKTYPPLEGGSKNLKRSGRFFGEGRHSPLPEICVPQISTLPQGEGRLITPRPGAAPAGRARTWPALPGWRGRVPWPRGAGARWRLPCRPG